MEIPILFLKFNSKKGHRKSSIKVNIWNLLYYLITYKYQLIYNIIVVGVTALAGATALGDGMDTKIPKIRRKNKRNYGEKQMSNTENGSKIIFTLRILFVLLIVANISMDLYFLGSVDYKNIKWMIVTLVFLFIVE
ncbi:hypothetical protein BWX42_08155 [Dolosigranulum pigrum]|uniref:Uncharacterized protein n=2 Tax=Dolosigranulum pigrum TaxID=29394 RepID=A0A1S8KPN2_9LACT|nr:hypothetical protein BWX42_08155 [Dolosigranulum pigrum]